MVTLTISIEPPDFKPMLVSSAQVYIAQAVKAGARMYGRRVERGLPLDFNQSWSLERSSRGPGAILYLRHHNAN